MSTPVRVQLRRALGWRLPENTVVVSRPTRWGNPFRYRDESRGLVRYGPKHAERFGREWDYEGRISGPGISHDMFLPIAGSDRLDRVETYVRWATRAELVELYRLTLTDPTPGMRSAYPSGHGRFAQVAVDDIRAHLAGKNLACWRPLFDHNGNPAPCHADVLLDIANPTTNGD